MVVLSVGIPRKVRIENTRLAVIYRLVQLCVLLLLIIPWALANGWYSTTAPEGGVSLFPSGSMIEEAAIQANKRDAQANHCTNPSKYEYCDSPACVYHYAPSSCMDICAGNTTEQCMDLAERWYLEDRGKGLFFPTYLNETLTWRDIDGKPMSENRQVFIKGVDDLGMMFDHHFVAPTLRSMSNIEGAAKLFDVQGQQTLPVLTVVKDSKGNIMSQMIPGESLLKLSLKDVLKAADLSLDDLNYRAGTNFAPGGEIRAGQLLRLSGAELFITLSYTNKHPYDWNGPICELTVRHNGYGSTLIDTSLLTTGGARLRFYAGIRIGFEIKGKFYWTDPRAISSFLAQTLVFLGVASTILEFFATRCLGDISRVYSRIISQRFSMSTCLIEETMKHMIYSSAFHSMKNEPEGMTQKGMQAALQRTFTNKDPTELLRLSHYMFEKIGLHTLEEPLMDVGHFVTVCSELEPIDAPLLARFFDVDVKRNFMERIFADVSVRELFGPESERPLRKLYAHKEHGELTFQERLHARLVHMEKHWHKHMQESANVAIQGSLKLEDSLVEQRHYESTEADIAKMSEQQLKTNGNQSAKYGGQRSTEVVLPLTVAEPLPDRLPHPMSDVRLNELARTLGAAHCVTIASPFVRKKGDNGARGGNAAPGNGRSDEKWDTDYSSIASMSLTDKLVAVIDGLSEKVDQLEADKHHAIDPTHHAEKNSARPVSQVDLPVHPMPNVHPMFDAKWKELTRTHGRNVSITDKLVTVVDGLCEAVAQLDATRWSLNQEIVTGMAGLEKRMVKIVEQVGAFKDTTASENQPAANRPPSIWFDVHIDQLRREVDAIKNREKLRAGDNIRCNQREIERQSDDQVQLAADICERLTNLEQQQRDLDVAVWKVREQVGSFLWSQMAPDPGSL